MESKPEYKIDYKVVPSKKVYNTMYCSHRWSSPPETHWLKEWKKATGNAEDAEPDCAFFSTSTLSSCCNKAVDGAYVYYDNNGSTNTCCHIVPVCEDCSKKDDLFTLKENMKTLELSLADFIPEKVIKLKENCEVQNVDGSSVDKRFSNNWIQKWKKETGNERPKCSNSDCKDGSNDDDDDEDDGYDNIVGAHVYIKGTTQNYYFIIPLCRSCNSKKNNLDWVKVIPGTLAFGLKNEIDNLKKKKDVKEE